MTQATTSGGERWALLLEQLGIDELKYAKRIKELIAQAVGGVYWDRLLSLVDARKPGSGHIVDHVARLLGAHRSTANRWFRGLTYPESNKYFVLLTELDIPLGEVDGPPRPEVIWRSIAQTLAAIRIDDLQLPERPSLTREQLECVRAIYLHRQGWVLFMKRSSEHLAPLLQEVSEDVARTVVKRYPDSQIRSSQDVRRVADDWLDAYALYLVGRPAQWTFLDAGHVR